MRYSDKGAARNQHHAAVGGFVLVLPAFLRSAERRTFRRRRSRALLDGRRRNRAGSIFTSAEPSTPSCICFTRASGTKCCSISAISRNRSRSSDSSIRESSSAKTVGKCRRALRQRRSILIDVIENYGADAFRCYEMFMGPLEQMKPWSMRGVEGVSRFLARVWRLIMDENQAGEWNLSDEVQEIEPRQITN